MTGDRRSARTWLTVLVVGLAVLIGLTFLLAQPYSRKPVDDYVAKVKAAGKPVTLRAALGPDPPAQVNGAVEIEAASRWMGEHLGAEDAWKVAGMYRDEARPRWFEELTDDERRDLDAFFAGAKPLFDGLAAGLAKPRVRTPTPPGDAAIQLTDIESRASVIRLLSAKALAASRPEDRLDATALLAALGVRLESRALFDEFLSAWAMDRAAQATLHSLERGGIDAAAWRARLDADFARPWLPRFRDAVRLERAYILDFLRTADFDQIAQTDTITTKRWTKVLLDRIASRLDSVVKGDAAPRGSPADLAQALAASETLESTPTDSYPRMAAEFARLGAGASQSYGHISVIRPIVQCAERLARTDAATRLARIALAAAEHRAKHGDFPASLDDLAGAFPNGVPLDPFTDAPFVYEKTATGVRISSAGRLAAEPPLSDATLRERMLVWALRR